MLDLPSLVVDLESIMAKVCVGRVGVGGARKLRYTVA